MLLLDHVRPAGSTASKSNASLSGQKRGLRLMLSAVILLGLAATWSSQSHAQSARKAISKEAPAFPSDALDEGIDSGSVKVRISVAGDGSVTGVEILEAQPKRIFDKAVTRAVMRWKYEATGTAETVDTQLTFKSR
jgi:protein TonB